VIHKRDFLKTGSTAVAAIAANFTGASATASVAAVRPSLDASAGLSSWQAHVGQRFEVDGHAVTLRRATALLGRQRGEQFSLHFAGALPVGLGNGIHTLTNESSGALHVYLARTPLGLRADFCRLLSAE
jgi:hypothetical protein